MGKVIGIIALKGGVGKTTSVAALGASLAQHFNKKVLMVDANFTAPNLAIHLGIMNPEKTLHDVFTNRINIKDAIYKTSHNVDVIPGSLMGTSKDCFALKKKLNAVKDDYDVILLDSSPNLNHEILSTMVASDELYVVTTPDFPTLSCTMKAVRIARSKKTPIVGLILNKVRDKKFELTIPEIEDASQSKVLAVLPDDVHILEALSKALPPTMHKHKTDSTVEYKKLAAFMIDDHFHDDRFKSRFTNFITKRMSVQDLNKNILRTNALGANVNPNVILESKHN